LFTGESERIKKDMKDANVIEDGGVRGILTADHADGRR